MILSTGNLILYFNKTTFGVERLSIEGDAERLSWVRGREFALLSGNNFLLKSDYAKDKFVGEFLFFCGLTCSVTVTAAKDGAAVFRYSFKNDTKKEIVTQKGEIGIYLPFNDDFDAPVISIRRRVHAHVRAQGQAYVFCERYSGDIPSLGLVVTEGESDSYSLERGGRKSSRGTIILDLPALRLGVEETYDFEFVLFACTDRNDFFRKAEGYGLITVQTSALVVWEGEEIILSSSNAQYIETEKDDKIPFDLGVCRLTAKGVGYHRVTVLGEKGSTFLTYFVLPSDLYAKRVDFLLKNQFISEGKDQGAFAAYDQKNVRKIVHAGVRSPFSLAGARSAPLPFLLRMGEKGALSEEDRAKLAASVAFYDREVIMENGDIADDVGRKRSRLCKRYYHHPLFAEIKYAEYRCFGDVAALEKSGEILIDLYHNGSVYEVAPTLAVESELRAAGMDDKAEALRSAVVGAADRLIRRGNKYAPFKGLPYGPEIVYGALSTLLDAYLLTKNEYYLSVAKEHFTRLQTFSFPSLDYATDEVPEIFQKDRGNGLTYDMSPHYTVIYFALVYEKYFRATGDARAEMLARRAVMAALSLFDADGRAVRSKAAPRSLNDMPLSPYEEISYGEDVVLYYFDLLFGRK